MDKIPLQHSLNEIIENFLNKLTYIETWTKGLVFIILSLQKTVG